MSIKRTVVPERNGRKSGLRRLIYRPQWQRQDTQDDWLALKDRLRRTVARVPEVVIKVSGGGTKIAGVLRYMNYISRNGALIASDEKGEGVSGRDNVKATHASWDLDLQRAHDRKGAALHQSFNIIFSMPAKTDPDKLFAAVHAFAREYFVRRQYLMVLHTPETDPSDSPPPHPHVHLAVRAEDEDGQRLCIRKSKLRLWREAFAAELRALGIEANATSRAERGVTFKGRGSAEYHIKERGEVPHVETRRFVDAVLQLEHGRTELKPWEIAIAARRRSIVDKLTSSANRLRDEGATELAEQVKRFARELPPLDTEMRKMQRAIIAQINERLKRDVDVSEKAEEEVKCSLVRKTDQSPRR
ncbi:relaxase/mobilization nuclease domain-containing protein [Massilia cellulosiltytica]|uniref:relaxase/mobilization nuclease domain-containing protein n=1 Tax=Massilia cellulosiltytica TaxID=2683234 RepID=UPI0039B52BF6